MVFTKICGLTTSESITACAEGGATMVGFVFYPPSPRFLSSLSLAATLSKQATGMQRVGLFVNPEEGEIERVLNTVSLDMLQLHGNETPARCAALRQRYQLPILKALPVETTRDLAVVPFYAEAVDMFLFDAKPPQGGLAGGNAVTFDWTLLKDKTIPRPWLLAGGLKAENVQEAITQSGAQGVDVSSGVEEKAGHKSPALISQFLRQVDKPILAT